ncbi:5'-nucleotidase C-terminal domain-containing protein [Robertkochia flava]|uniref:5'-nucleotidase C-terminal domain-containing protein n=1 Tax=Robertkochia flava TaxID=3447986 RepID=UPI001CCA41D9|nr:5'-nucleotidase [Robertkochia marina]
MCSCKQTPPNLQEIHGNEIGITSELTEPDSLEQFIEPYRTHLDSVLSEVLCYAPRTLSKTEGRYNTAIGNLLCDIIYEQANPVFQSRTANTIDIVLINHGGIRSVISKGPVTRKTAYEVMPFENTIEVLELTTEKIDNMVEYLIAARRPHPFKGLKITLDENGNLRSYSINGAEPDQSRTYFVATSNYLANMGDNMTFFANPVNRQSMDYLIRNAMIDYFEKQDTLTAEMDDRFTGPN